jgi:hypothetical protein
MLIWGRRHLERVLGEYVRHDNDGGRTEALRFTRRWASPSDPCSPLLRSPIGFGGGIVSGVWCTSTTTLRYDVRVSEL